MTGRAPLAWYRHGMSNRGFFCVDVSCGLFHPERGQAPGEKTKTWFFEVPTAQQAPPSDAYWEELLHRIFFDANTRLRQREPTDLAWLQMLRFSVKAVDPKSILAWDGKGAQLFPWVAAQRAVVWEPGAMYFVDDAGQYDVLDYVAYTELMMNRMLDAQQIDEATFRKFMGLFFPGNAATAAEAFTDRMNRMKNITLIRPTPGASRKTPNALPVTSRPD